MKKFILCIYFFLIWSNISFANQYILTCTSDKNFLTVYSVNEKLKKITHLSSMSLISNQKFNDINYDEKIVSWKNKEVHTFDSDKDGVVTLKSFDLKNFNYISLSPYLYYSEYENWNHGYSYGQFFKCIKG